MLQNGSKPRAKSSQEKKSITIKKRLEGLEKKLKSLQAQVDLIDHDSMNCDGYRRMRWQRVRPDR